MIEDIQRARFGRREVQRIEALYGRIPSIVVSSLLGVLLVFAFLAPIASFNLLKAWAAFQLTTLALRSWLWHLFRTACIDPDTVRRWEWLFAAGTFLTGLGWAALIGPLYPDDPQARVFILLLVMMSGIAGAVYVSLSTLAAASFLLPTLLPLLGRYISQASGLLDGPVLAVAGCVFVIVSVQRSVHRFAIKQLDHAIDIEELLEEQHTIFQTAPLGIAVFEGNRMLKANARLPGLFGYRHAEFLKQPVSEHFTEPGEAEQFEIVAGNAMRTSQPFQGIYRVRRADGSQFWAEFTGQGMGGQPLRSVWTISDVTLRASQPAGQIPT